ncbi:DUF86 domain-containing protein [Paenibacillus sp. 481]|uniref:DUF86 domain-containing protein n=1 Tax=Paenibacillus sp. 481 TaxID=2835869 RepID=UPI001E339CBF|nr:HepT-like ribonuclease domain-containing protein [Paenibacillus sp. 481]UHA72554.1 DUF86 domain-containing protein [Paenibacillus sp. 481]
MYYVNVEQLERRLNSIDDLVQAVESIQQQWDGGLVVSLAQERVLHLAIEIVTDIGSLLIDGFLLRDASSYEDIVEIMAQEGAVHKEIQESLLELVRLRRPLVQSYDEWKRGELHPLLVPLTTLLPAFAVSVRAFVSSEMKLGSKA